MSYLKNGQRFEKLLQDPSEAAKIGAAIDIVQDRRIQGIFPKTSKGWWAPSKYWLEKCHYSEHNSMLSSCNKRESTSRLLKEHFCSPEQWLRITGLGDECPNWFHRPLCQNWNKLTLGSLRLQGKRGNGLISKRPCPQVKLWWIIIVAF